LSDIDGDGDDEAIISKRIINSLKIESRIGFYKKGYKKG